MKKQNLKKDYSLLLPAGLILFTLFSLSIFILFLNPYDTTASIVNHLAKDGYLESFKPQIYKIIQLPFLILSGLFSGIFLFGLILFKETKLFIVQILKKIPDSIKDFLLSWKKLFAALHSFCDREVCLTLLALLILAFLMRIFLIQRPMQHDEAYSAVVFAF
ncbi:MAG: hypothetical protein CVU41_16170 [Chloroflexi bacterium HGW-Chloroflexi-3]|nr:MAG: hypothetical protein CVU41_16170 [Chloroflexi bacterium HGW-Chloroflexi-3]